eukprot:236315_1
MRHWIGIGNWQMTFSKEGEGKRDGHRSPCNRCIYLFDWLEMFLISNKYRTGVECNQSIIGCCIVSFGMNRIELSYRIIVSLIHSCRISIIAEDIYHRQNSFWDHRELALQCNVMK